MLGSGLANFDLISDSKARGIYRIALPPKYKGFLYPQFLNDTYSFSLTLYHPQRSGYDEISFSELSQLKPPADFFAGTYAGSQDETGKILSQAFWGSTILLSGFIAQSRPDKAESLKSTADELLKQFLGIDSLEEALPFYQSGEFLGGYIYEYKSIFRTHNSNPKSVVEDPHPQPLSQNGRGEKTDVTNPKGIAKTWTNPDFIDF